MSNVKTIKCQGFELVAPQPYTEGHPLTESEAAVLNQTLVENLRNNFASRIRARQEAATEKGETYQADPADLQAEFDEYVAAYEFGVRVSSGPRQSADPVESEALRMARTTVSKAIQAKGHKIKDVPKEKLAELVEQFFNQNKEALMAQAQTVVDAQKAVSSMNLDM